MSTKKPDTPAEPQEPVAIDDWAALLSADDVKNLAGFFDVLIEMDFEAKRNEQRMKNETITDEDNANGQLPAA